MKLPVALALAGATVVGASLMSVDARANLLLNGDFETLSSPDVPADWTTAPGAEILDLTGADYIPCCGANGTAAELANHFASFGPGNVPNVSTLSQSFTTVSGQSYILSFMAGAMGGGTEPLVAAAWAAGGGTPLNMTSITTSADNNLSTTFIFYSFLFTATSDSSYVAFNAVGPGSNIDPILDDVSVAATPLPSTWTMLIAGFAGLGFFAYRGSKKNAAAIAAA
jgi:hypothetical protein